MKLFDQYKNLDRSIVFLIIAQFFIQLIDYSYLTILLQYMVKEHYTDSQSADFLGYRFLSVLLFSFYLGFYINGRKIKPLFYISAILTPLISLGIIYAIQYHLNILVYSGMFLLGISVMGLEVAMLPFILRNVKSKHHTEAISLSYATASLGGIFSGVIIFGLTYLNPNLFDEKLILKIISVIGFAGIFFVYAYKKKEFRIPILKRSRYDVRDIKWGLIIKAMVPTLLLATGAGLAIPFMGLFFLHIHHIESYKFAMISSITTLIVFLMTLYVPNIKNYLGNKGTVVGSQTLAVLCLIGLSFSQFYGLPLFAVICYMLRQPLMNIAMPVTSDITMKYVGFRHRELVSALTAAIWSGSWFFSSQIFKVLRNNNVDYAHIFYITAILYVFGICWYYYLIVQYEKKEELEKVPS